jgi:hypothetical protein
MNVRNKPEVAPVDWDLKRWADLGISESVRVGFFTSLLPWRYDRAFLGVCEETVVRRGMYCLPRLLELVKEQHAGISDTEARDRLERLMQSFSPDTRPLLV